MLIKIIDCLDTLRFIEEPPCSPNEDLAGLMRSMNICEEQGSGFEILPSTMPLPLPIFFLTLCSPFLWF